LRDPSLVDEIYIKVGSKGQYLFRAVDRQDPLIDFILANRSNKTLAHRFLEKALKTIRHWPLSSITTDHLGSYAKAISHLQRGGKRSDSTKHRTNKYLNNIIETEHGALKRVICPTCRGFQTLKTASAAIKRFEGMRMTRRGIVLRASHVSRTSFASSPSRSKSSLQRPDR
jgi:IS6 family transposase